jgi:endonuclease/exonuclease/phosphatase family metal-dependent hydrolase
MGGQPRLRVVTYNVLGPANPLWERRLPLIAATLRRLDADIVALQEVPPGDPAVVRRLVDATFTVRPFSRTAPDGVGGLLATRWPHRVVAELDQRLDEQSLPWAATLLVEVETPVGPTLVAHHKPSWPFTAEKEREQQALAAARLVEQHAVRGQHALLLGDLDATPDAASVQFLRGRRSLAGEGVCYQDAWETAHPDDPGHTFSAENPLVRAGEVATAVSRRIDYVLVRSGPHGPSLQVLSCERLLDRPVDGVWGSDHYGVVVDLAVPGHAPGSWGALPS